MSSGIETSKRKKLLLAAVSVLFLFSLYLVSYVYLRASHRITHLSNEQHWDPDKRSPGHYVRTSPNRSASDKFIGIAFKPLMLLEETYHNLID